MVTITFLIDEDKRKQFKHLAIEKGKTVTDLLIEYIDKEIHEYEQWMQQQIK